MFRLNGYAWAIIIAFIFVAFAMQYHVALISFKDFFQAIPLIIVVVYGCQKSAQLVTQVDASLNKTALFKRDLFLLSFSFFLASLISLIFAYDNSDARGWWVFIMYFYALYSVLFSLIASAIALLIKNHKTYIICFSLLLIILTSFAGFFPHDVFIPVFGRADTFFVIMGLLLIVHALFAIGCKLNDLFSDPKIQ